MTLQLARHTHALYIIAGEKGVVRLRLIATKLAKSLVGGLLLWCYNQRAHLNLYLSANSDIQPASFPFSTEHDNSGLPEPDSSVCLD
jgi:hypothetical protein